jgi:hypothetical protein
MPVPAVISDYLANHHVPYTVIPHKPAYTAQESAAVTHVPGGNGRRPWCAWPTASR